jgi:hypothetical protein
MKYLFYILLIPTDSITRLYTSVDGKLLNHNSCINVLDCENGDVVKRDGGVG